VDGEALEEVAVGSDTVVVAGGEAANMGDEAVGLTPGHGSDSLEKSVRPCIYCAPNAGRVPILGVLGELLQASLSVVLPE
jgi:hypothetical protein